MIQMCGVEEEELPLGGWKSDGWMTEQHVVNLLLPTLPPDEYLMSGTKNRRCELRKSVTAENAQWRAAYEGYLAASQIGIGQHVSL